MAKISDHALLRYLERVKGIDLEEARREMRCPALLAAIEMGARTVIHGSGARFKISGDTVVTVLSKDMYDHESREIRG